MPPRPRIRSIKPEFFTSRQLVECSPTARLLFVGMWCFCDDGGVHLDDAKQLKMEVFAGDDDIPTTEVHKLLDELIAVGLVQQFEAEDESYLYVTGWKHQKIDKPTYRYPGPNSTSNRIVLDECSTSRRHRRGGEGKGSEGRGKDHTPLNPPKGDGEGNGKPEPKLLLMQTMVEAWNAKATDHPDDLVAVSQLTDQRKTKLRTRLKDATWQVRFAEALARLPIEPIGDRAWRPTFDWLIQNDTNASKLAEGQYQSKQVKLSLQEIFERELGGTE